MSPSFSHDWVSVHVDMSWMSDEKRICRSGWWFSSGLGFNTTFKSLDYASVNSLIFRFFSQIKVAYFPASHWLVLEIPNAETSADKKTFEQLPKLVGVIFQCICIIRRLLIHIFSVPEYLKITLKQWELSFFKYSSLLNMLGEEMNLFLGCVIAVMQREQSGTREDYYPKHCLVLFWVMSYEHALKCWKWGGGGKRKGIWAALKPLTELFIRSSYQY